MLAAATIKKKDGHQKKYTTRQREKYAFLFFGFGERQGGDVLLHWCTLCIYNSKSTQGRPDRCTAYFASSAPNSADSTSSCMLMLCFVRHKAN